MGTGRGEVKKFRRWKSMRMRREEEARLRRWEVMRIGR
jgi:hypothetical protein